MVKMDGEIGAPGRDRTCDLRFRKPLLYPLSYGGGDGAERGAKVSATARKPWGKGSSVSVRRLKVQFNQTEVSSGVWAR